jgi:hypothetical protein
MREWWNWFTRTIEVRMPQGVEVRVLSRAHKSRLIAGFMLQFFYEH